jgi:predicted nucleic acid-binding protein
VIVVDASVLATALGDDGPDGDRARARLRGERLSAPELVDLEVASVLRRQVQGGAVDSRRAALALADLAALPLRRAPHRPLLVRCWELRDNLTVYDASYVALAEALDVTLLTGDGRLARAPGPRCRVEMLRPASLSTPDAASATTSASDPRHRAHQSNGARSKVDLEVMLTGHATLNDGRGPENARRAVPAACGLRGLKPCDEPGL